MRDKVRNKVLAAISELNGATTWMERKKVAINNRKVLLSDITLQVLEELISIASMEEEGPATVLKQYRDLLVRARSEGIDTAFEDQTALEAMLAFLEAKTWDQARKVVEYYKHELFSPAAESIFADLLARYTSPAEQRFLNLHRQILSAVQERGIKTAFSGPLPPKDPAHIDALLQAAADKLSEGHTESALADSDQAVAAAELLGLPDLLARSLSFRATLAELSGDTDTALDLRARAAVNWEQTGEGPNARAERLRRIEILLETEQDLQIEEQLSELEALAKYPDAAIKALKFKLRILERVDMHEESLKTLDRLSDLLVDTTDPVIQANNLVDRGIVLSQLNRLDEASKVYDSAERIIPRIGDSRVQGTLWHKIAYFYEHFTHDLNRSVDYYHRAEVCYGRAHDSTSQAEVWLSLGYLYSGLNMSESAYRYWQMAEQFFTEQNDLERLCRVQDTLGIAFYNAGDYEAAIGYFTNAISIMQELADRNVLTDMDLVNPCFRLFCAVILHEDYLSAGEILDRLTELARLQSLSIDPHLQVGKTILELMESKRQARINWDELRENTLVQSAGTDVQSLLKKPKNAEDVMRLYNVLCALILGTRHDVDEYEDMFPQNLLAKQAVKVWQQGIAVTKGWRRTPNSSETLATIPYLAENDSSDNTDLKAVREFIYEYHQLGVWEDPNLALFDPIIDTYCNLTRFSGKSLINPQTLSDGFLHFFFYRSDPKRRLLGHWDSCVYIESGHVVFCSLPFLEDLAGFVDVPDEEAERIRSGLANTEFSGVDPNWFVAILRARNRALIEWVIAHEIGHAQLDHPSPFLAPTRHSREYERAADEFFVDNIDGLRHAGELMQGLSSSLITLYSQHYQDQFGTPYDGPDPVTTNAPITIRDSGGQHPPLLIRLLDLADLILERYPSIDVPDYYHQVRQNITVEKDSM